MQGNKNAKVKKSRQNRKTKLKQQTNYKTKCNRKHSKRVMMSTFREHLPLRLTEQASNQDVGASESSALNETYS